MGKMMKMTKRRKRIHMRTTMKFKGKSITRNGLFYKGRISLNYLTNSERKDGADLLREIILLIDFQSIIFPVANSIQSACTQGSINENWQAWTVIEANLFGIMSVIKYSTSY